MSDIEINIRSNVESTYDSAIKFLLGNENPEFVCEEKEGLIFLTNRRLIRIKTKKDKIEFRYTHINYQTKLVINRQISLISN